MSKKPDADFETFKKEFARWQKLFGLTGYKVYFKHEPLDKAFADNQINQRGMVVSVRFNSQLPKEDKPDKNTKGSAKHEAIHLLVGRLVSLAEYRYSSENEIYEATEELVRKLQGLIEG